MGFQWTRKAARMGEELERTGQVALGATALARGAERAIRFLLGAVLAGGEIFGGYAPFGVGLVASSGSGVDGLCALLGACFGYLTFRGFTSGLRYAAACVLVFSVAFAFYDAKFYQKSWFMPLTAAGMNAITGFVYLSDAAWRASQVVFFTTEVILAGCSAYLYRLALSPWQSKGEEPALSTRQTVSLCFLLATVLISLGGITFLGDLSLGRVAAVALVMACAHSGGAGVGAAVGVAAGLGMDLASGQAPFYAMAYGFAGLLTGAGWRRGRLFGALTYVVANAAAVLWGWEELPRVSALYETFIASVAFFLLPQTLLRRLGLLLTRRQEEGSARRAAEYVGERLAATAAAFRAVCVGLRGAFAAPEPNDNDASTVFDRAAERVCRRCVLRNTCWEHDYVSTFNALNDALPALLEKGKGEAGDFPAWFTGRCAHFADFLRAANEEVTALLYRRQYKSRVRESRRAVCRQYEALADVLSSAATELAAELTVDPVREKRLRRHLAALGLEGDAAVYYDEAGHLRVEVAGEGARALTSPEEVDALSRIMDVPLRTSTEDKEGKTVLLQAEPLMAVAGLAARRKEGQRESGDTGMWFKRADGSLFVLLCDGMGSGAAAHRESALAVRLMEEFLRAGLDAPAAMRTVNSALALRNEESGAFTTVDLLRVDLFTGAGEVCKLGAAPTYIRKGAAVSRITGAALPAGLTDGDNVGPDVTKLQLEPGDYVLLLSDGVAEPADDGWVRELLAAFEGDSPKDLARSVMEESERRVGAADDRTAVVIRLGKR